jgi:hypothetical protein
VICGSAGCHDDRPAGAAALGPGIEPAMETAAITWTSDDPHFSGNYASVFDSAAAQQEQSFLHWRFGMSTRIDND